MPVLDALPKMCEEESCMPLTECFKDGPEGTPPITEIFRVDVEQYEHDHEIGANHHHSKHADDNSDGK